jgi:hypothetical protein
MEYNRILVDSVLHIPALADTNRLHTTNTSPQIGVLNNKLLYYSGHWREAGNGSGSSYSFTTPLTESSGVVGIPYATGSVNGYLKYQDWNTFKNKLGNLQSLTSSVSWYNFGFFRVDTAQSYLGSDANSRNAYFEINNNKNSFPDAIIHVSGKNVGNYLRLKADTTGFYFINSSFSHKTSVKANGDIVVKDTLLKDYIQHYGGGISTVNTTPPIMGDGSSGNHVRVDTGYHPHALSTFYLHQKDSIAIASKTQTPGLFLAFDSIRTVNFTAQVGYKYILRLIRGNIIVTLPSVPLDKSNILFKIDSISGTSTATINPGATDYINTAYHSITLQLQFQGLLLGYTTANHIWYATANDLPLSKLDARYFLRTDTANTTQNGGMSKTDYQNLLFVTPVFITYTTSIPFGKQTTYIAIHTLVANDIITINSTGAVDGGGAIFSFQNNGTNAPDLTAFTHIVGYYDKTFTYSKCVAIRQDGTYILYISNYN